MDGWMDGWMEGVSVQSTKAVILGRKEKRTEEGKREEGKKEDGKREG